MLKLHAGVSKKVGLPGFSSASASCTIEAELDSTLLNDTDGFQIVVQRAYASCEQAVQDQIARLTSEDQHDASQPHAQPQEVIEVRTSPAISGARITTNSADSGMTNREPSVMPPAPDLLPLVRSKPFGPLLHVGRSTLWGCFGISSGSPLRTNWASGRRAT